MVGGVDVSGKRTWPAELLMIGCLSGPFLLPGTFLGALAAWGFAILLPLLYAAKSPLVAPRRLFAVAFVCHCLAFYWLPSVISNYFHCGLLSSLVASLIYLAYSSLQFRVFAWVNKHLDFGLFRRTHTALPLAWYSVEVFYPKLFPWALGHTQLAAAPLAQLADLLGVPFISAMLLWWGGLISCLIRSSLRKSKNGELPLPLRPILLALTVSLAAVLGYGYYRIKSLQIPIGSAPALSVGLVQGNVPPPFAITSETIAHKFQTYEQLSRELLRSHSPELILWPESAVELALPESSTNVYEAALPGPLPNSGQTLLFGARTVPVTMITPSFSQYNTAFLVDPQGGVLGRYHKEIPLPFAEALVSFPPVRELQNFITGGRARTLSAAENRALSFRTTSQNEVKLAMSICYEDLWPGLFVKKIRQDSANLLVVISNDAWFLHRLALYQHHLLSAWRAIETRRFFLRVTNDGITEVISPLGTVLESLPPFSEGTIFFEHIGLLEGASPFVRGGLQLSRALALVILLIALGRCALSSLRTDTTSLSRC